MSGILQRMPENEVQIDLGANLRKSVSQAKPRSQQMEGRLRRKIEFRSTATLGTEPGLQLISPVTVKVDDHGTVYVLDWGVRMVKQFRGDG